MTLDQVRKLTPLERLIYWIKERESVRIKRSLGLPDPWTDDSILQRYRFCNVRRMDDKVSDWLYRRWYKPYRDHPNMVLAATLARMLNNPESLAAVGFPDVWDPTRVDKILHERAEQGLKNFSGAYMITGTLGGTKVHQVVWKVCDQLHKDPPLIDGTDIQKAAASLVPYNGFSYFMAGQVVADLRWAMTGVWKGKNTWAPIGPGSKRGMNILLGNDLYDGMSERAFLGHFQTTMKILKKILPESITKRLEAHDYQNCLCEFHKYHKALFGLGKPKQLYRGGGA